MCFYMFLLLYDARLGPCMSMLEGNVCYEAALHEAIVLAGDWLRFCLLVEGLWIQPYEP